MTSRAYHALFMRNMLVEPTAEEAANFVPDFTILNAGCFPANRCAPAQFGAMLAQVSDGGRKWTVDEPLLAFPSPALGTPRG